MKPPHFYIAVAISALCFLLSITVILLGNSNQKLQNALQKQQTQLQSQQEEINRGNAGQQVGSNILRDMATVSVDDKAMKDVLAKHGYTVNVATPAPGDSKAP